MPVNIVASSLQITSAIDAFPGRYHLAFTLTIALARQYLRSAKPTPALVTALASQLRQTLVEYGAGARGAPSCRPLADVQNVLADPLVVDALRAVAKSARRLRMSGTSRSVFAGMGVAQFESQMLTALTQLSLGLFIDCSNVTYPMKALMLLTGAIPAFDSQVKKGLSLGGFPGFASTRYLFDTAPNSAGYTKLTRLPFLLGDCHWRHRALLSEAVARSTQPQLVRYPGRLFDVLLFVQARDGHPVIVELTGGAPDWHRLD